MWHSHASIFQMMFLDESSRVFRILTTFHPGIPCAALNHSTFFAVRVELLTPALVRPARHTPFKIFQKHLPGYTQGREWRLLLKKDPDVKFMEAKCQHVKWNNWKRCMQRSACPGWICLKKFRGGAGLRAFASTLRADSPFGESQSSQLAICRMTSQLLLAAVKHS